MLYGFECECGEEVDARRVVLGYQTCLRCGDKEAKKRRFTVAPINKSNYMMITDLSQLKQLNPKRTT
jgi:hypothetical protein